MSEEHTSTGTGDRSDVQDPGDVSSENGSDVRNAGGGKSGYPQSPRENGVETPVDDEDRDGGESLEKALSSHDREVRQKAEQ